MFLCYLATIQQTKVIVSQEHYKKIKSEVTTVSSVLLKGMVSDMVGRFLGDTYRCFLESTTSSAAMLPKYPLYQSNWRPEMNVVAHSYVLNWALTCGLDGMQQFASSLDSFFSSLSETPLDEKAYRFYIQQEVWAGKLVPIVV